MEIETDLWVENKKKTGTRSMQINLFYFLFFYKLFLANL